MKILFAKDWKKPKKTEVFGEMHWVALHRIYEERVVLKECKYVDQKRNKAELFNKKGLLTLS